MALLRLQSLPAASPYMHSPAGADAQAEHNTTVVLQQPQALTYIQWPAWQSYILGHSQQCRLGQWQWQL
jgi:hypothetical protein